MIDPNSAPQILIIDDDSSVQISLALLFKLKFPPIPTKNQSVFLALPLGEMVFLSFFRPKNVGM